MKYIKLIRLAKIPNEFLINGFPVIWDFDSQHVKGYIVRVQPAFETVLIIDFSEEATHDYNVRKFIINNSSNLNNENLPFGHVAWIKEYTISTFVDVSRCKRLNKLF
ncbi:MAG TPA: hypothetical protein VMV86_04315 [Methanosarcinales archaeon]|nr:hypothetical protein [Methanosarcinales archaeon]